MPIAPRNKKPSRRVSAIERFWIQTEKAGLNDCWIWTGCWNKENNEGSNRHQRISVNGKYIYVHRFAYELLVGPMPVGMQVLHKCDTPRCVNPRHLFLGTQADNIHDMESKGRGRHLNGEKNGQAKLTDIAVLEIRNRYKRLSYREDNARELAKEFGVTYNVIRRVTQRWNFSNNPE